MIKFIEFTDKTISSKNHNEIWKLEIPMTFKTKDLRCKTSEELFAFMLNDGPDDNIMIYLYDITSNKYIGFINVS